MAHTICATHCAPATLLNAVPPLKTTSEGQGGSVCCETLDVRGWRLLAGAWGARPTPPCALGAAPTGSAPLMGCMLPGCSTGSTCAHATTGPEGGMVMVGVASTWEVLLTALALPNMLKTTKLEIKNFCRNYRHANCAGPGASAAAGLARGAEVVLLTKCDQGP